MDIQRTHSITVSGREIVELLKARYPTAMTVQAIPEDGARRTVTTGTDGSLTVSWKTSVPILSDRMDVAVIAA